MFNKQYIHIQKLAKKQTDKRNNHKEINTDEDAEEGEPLFTIGDNINLSTQY